MPGPGSETMEAQGSQAEARQVPQEESVETQLEMKKMFLEERRCC